MGFNLYGLRPRDEVGVYFRNNVWWWRPLADYVLAVCSDLFRPGEAQYWDYNDGPAVSAETAHAIGKRLRKLLASGAVARYAAKHEAERKALPLKVCEFCDGTGDRPDLGPPEWKAACGGCNGCLGAGWVEDPLASYPFSEDNAKDFIAFCETCGGFRIC